MPINAAGLVVAGEMNPNWKGGKVALTCFVCGAGFSVIPSRANKARTCSLACWNQHQKAVNPPEMKPKWPYWKPCSSLPIAERIRARSVVMGSGCMEWTDRLSRAGYGRTTYLGKEWGAHRLSWFLKNGPIPDGMNVLHKCDNPPCINPEHLFLGTHLDNMRDMAAKGRAKSGGVFGEDHGHAKLTSNEVEEILIALALAKSKDGTSGRLALKYGVSDATISHIKHGKAWAKAKKSSE